MQALPHGATPAGLEPTSCPVPVPQQEQDAQESDASMMPTLHSVWETTRNFLCNAARTLWRHDDLPFITFTGVYLMQDLVQPMRRVEAVIGAVATGAAALHVGRYLVAVTQLPQMAGVVQQDPLQEPADPKQEELDVEVVN